MARGPFCLLTFLVAVLPLLSALSAGDREVQGALQPPAGPEVTILRADERGVLFEYRPKYLPPREVREGNASYVVYDFAGSASRRGTEAAGEPDVRYRPFPLAFPGATGHQVRVVAADYEDIPAQLVAPVPSSRIQDDMVESGAYIASPERYARSGSIPEQVVEIGPVQQARTLLVGDVRVYPVQCNPSARTVRKYSRMVVEVTFGPKTTAAARNDDEFPFRNVLLNYNQAAVWKVASPRSVPVPTVLANGPWYRLTVTSEGVYKLDQKFLSDAGINVGALDPRTIKIYGNGGGEIPESVTAPRPSDLVENAIYIEGEADGQFGAGDVVLFYARGVRGWRYDAAGRTIRHYINHYTETNTYWLTYGGAPGKRMAPLQSLADPPASTPDRFTDGAFVEEEKVNLVRSGKDWLGTQIQNNSSFTHIIALPGLVGNDNLIYRYNLVGQALNSAITFTVRESGTTIGIHSIAGVTENGYEIARAGAFQVQGTSSLPAQESRINVAVTSGNPNAQGWIDWVEVVYPRSFSAVGDYLRFRGPDFTGVVEYRLQQFTARPWIFNVSDPANVRLVTDVGGSYLFRAAATAGAVSEFVAASAGAWKVPAGIQSVLNQDLHGYSAGADFIILTSSEYLAAAQKLKAHREQPAYGGLKTVIVDVQQVYNEFAGGLPDVVGIRDFLKYAYENWTPSPRFVLFLGGASYDYKGILGKRTSFVPTWQSKESLNDVYSYSSDDFFTMTNATLAPSYIHGRIPARSAAEADVVVSKIIRYDAAPARDAWKYRIMFIGDDAYTTTDIGGGEGTMHSGATETLSSLAFTPQEFEPRKIYLADYPTVYTAQGRRKPGAFQDIITTLNQGSLMFNYVGHGNPLQLAHENVFNVQSSVPALVNADRLCLFILVTCNFSQFDDPQRTSGGELLMNKPDGGAIGVISAARKVFAYQNEILNQGLYTALFTRDSFGRVAVQRPATALFLYKATRNSDNDQKYFYMGDPTMYLSFPRGYASIDSINHERVDSANGTARTRPIAVQSLGRVRVYGSVRNQSNQVDSTFNGTALLTVNDVTRDRLIVNFTPGFDWPYKAPGGLIYQGANSVTNGRFAATFIVPKDVVFADSMARGRLTAYLTSASTDGLGYTGNITIQGTDTTAVNDRQGPAINVYLDNRSFRAGDLVSDKPVLYVDLADSSGINSSGAGIGHRIEAWVNNSAQSLDLTSAYVSKQDDYREGTVTRPLNGLQQGRNSLRVRAWDTFNNSSMAETFFTVASSANLTITDVMNYPNPFTSTTEFTFRQNQTGMLNVKVRIYTLAGRLIQTLTSVSSASSFVRIPWDGRDRDGDIPANGVYLYKVIVQTADGRFSSEALGKLSILR